MTERRGTPPREPGAPAYEDVEAFVRQILSTGLMLGDLVHDLLGALPEDAFPGEEPIRVLLEMLTGTIMPAATAAGARRVRDATALLGAVGDRTLTDLSAAAELASRRR